MRLALCCLALGALPMPGQVAAIALYTHFQHPPPEALFTSIRHEAASLMLPMGLELDWRDLDSVRGNEVSRELAVIKFKGTCDADGPPAAPFREGGLGWTHMSDGEILPFMDIECDHIRGFLRKALAEMPRAARDEVLGRAIARVVVHELYHILGRTAHHGSGTVDHSAYTVQELMSDQFQLEDGECRIVEVSKSRPVALRDLLMGRIPGSLKQGQIKYAEKGCSVCHGPHGEGTRHGPSLRAPGHLIQPSELATRIGIDGRAMCRRADQLKVVPPSLAQEDIADLVRFLNTPLY